MSKKPPIEPTPGGIVIKKTTQETLLDIIPAGKVVVVKSFGGCAPEVGDGVDGIISLEWGSGTTWTKIKVGCKQFDFDIRKDFVGDGVKRLRILRENPSNTDRVIYAWLEALVR